MSYNGSGTFNINTAGQPVVTGTVISSSVFNALTADLATGLSTAITKDGQTTITNNIPFNNYKITNLGAGTASTDAVRLGQLQAGTATAITVTGTDTYTGTMSPALASYTAGNTFSFIVPNTNTTGCTLNIDGQGAKAITRDGSTALIAGDLVAGSEVVVIYDGTRFQVLNSNSKTNWTVSNALTLSAGTSNQVQYLNGSKVMTGSSNLTFNGTTLTANTLNLTNALGTAYGGTGLTSFTANGVLYASSSSALTTGSALTFDGTNLGIGTSIPSVKLDVVGATTSGLRLRSSSASSNGFNIYNDSTTDIAYLNNYYNGAIVFGVNNAEQMRLTSTGLGIGTSSPGEKLEVKASSAMVKINSTASFAQLGYYNNGSLLWNAYADISSGEYRLGNSSITPFILTSSGNLGLGVTPSAWESTAKAFQFGSLGYVARGSSGQTLLGYNNYVNTSNQYIYLSTTQASRYEQVSGEHRWYIAPSGTAGNVISFTQAMTLNASGGLSVGTTTDAGSGNLLISGSYQTTGASFVYSSAGGSAGAVRSGFQMDGTNNVLALYTAQNERARIDSSGNLLVGKTASAATSVGFQVDGTGALYTTKSTSTNADATYYLYSTGASAYRFYVDMAGTIFATNTTISAISDQRLKENVRDLDAGLDAVMALKPRKFDWKAGKGKDIKNDRGFIAQEFEQVFPDLIDTWKDPAPEGEEPYKSVRQDLIPVLVKAIQEQQAIIEQLKADVAALKGA